MKLSELIALCRTNVDRSAAYGVEVDDGIQDFDPPQGISEIGLIARFDGASFADDVLDVAISYKMSPAPMSVILEIAAEAEVAEIAQVVATVEAVNASASLLPPVSGGDEDFEAYLQRLEAATHAYCARTNFQQSLYPVTTFFQQSVLELLSRDAADEPSPPGGYVFDTFHSKMSADRWRTAKRRVSSAIRACFTDDEGVDRFDEAMLAVCRRELEDVESLTKAFADQFEAAVEE